MRNLFSLAAALIGFLLPQAAAAAILWNTGSGGINVHYLQGYAGSILYIINGILVPILMAVAFLVFIYGVVKYFFFGADSESAKGEGRTFVLWGIIGFAVILSIWGLVYITLNTFGLGAGGPPPAGYPTL